MVIPSDLNSLGNVQDQLADGIAGYNSFSAFLPDSLFFLFCVGGHLFDSNGFVSIVYWTCAMCLFTLFFSGYFLALAKNMVVS